MKRILFSFIIFTFLLCACANEGGSKNSTDRESKSSGVKNTGSEDSAGEETPMPSSQETEAPRGNLSENDKAHEAYQKYLQSGEGNAPSEYAYWDIDGDGVDELIGSGYFATEVHTFADGKMKDVHYQKYGGDFKIYPGKGIIYFPHGGHMDHYYKQYVRLAGGESAVAAIMDWSNEFVPDPDHVGEYKAVCVKRTYKINGKKTSKKAYRAFQDSLKGEKVITHRDVAWKRVVTREEKEQLQSLVANRKNWQFPEDDYFADNEKYAYMVSDLDDDEKMELVLCLSNVGTGFYSYYSVQEVAGVGKLKVLEHGGKTPDSFADMAASDKINVYVDEEGCYHYCLRDLGKNGGEESWDGVHDFSLRKDRIYDSQICRVKYWSKRGEQGDRFHHASYYRGEGEKISKREYRKAKKEYYAGMEKYGTISFDFEYGKAMYKKEWESLSDEELLACLMESWEKWNL